MLHIDKLVCVVCENNQYTLKSFLDYLLCLIWCKHFVNSCYSVLFREECQEGKCIQTDAQYILATISLFWNIVSFQVVESGDVNSKCGGPAVP